MIGRLWALAKVTIAQGVRMKVFVVVVIFLIVALIGLPHVLQTDGTQLGRARLVMSYTMYLTMFLLSVLTLFLAVSSVAQEIEQRQIFILDPKPVARWQIFAGKWIGIMILNVGLLIVMGGASYAGLRYITRPGPEDTDEDYQEFQVRFMVAKDKLLPDLPYDIDERIEAEHQQWVADGRISPDRSKRWVARRMVPVIARQLNSVRPTAQRSWVFSDLPKISPDKPLQFRFKHYVTHRKTADEVGRMTVPGYWFFGSLEHGFVERPYDATPDDHHEFEVPASVIAPDGTVTVVYFNMSPDSPTVIFPFEDGLELYYPVGAMEPNFARAMLIFLIMLGFLAILGLACGANLSFPVAVLLAVTVFMVGMSWDFLGGLTEQAYVFGPDVRQPFAAMSRGDMALQAMVKGTLYLFPPLLRHSPVAQLGNAEVISWREIGRAFLDLILIRGVLVAILGAFIFHKRELGTTEGQ